MPFDWGGAAGGGQDALQTMLEQRILQEKMALLQRQQQAEEEYRAAQMAQQERQFGQTHGLAERRLNEVDVPTAQSGTTFRRIQGDVMQRGDQREQTAFDQQQGAQAELAKDPRLAPVLRLMQGTGARPSPVSLFDPEGETEFKREKDLANIRGRWGAANSQPSGEKWVTVKFFNPESGFNETYVGPQSGAPTGTMRAPLTSAGQTAVASGKATQQQLKDLLSLYKPEFVGPFMGNALEASTYIPGSQKVRPEGWAEFAAANAAFENQVIKDITGAQMSEPEATRIKRQVPRGTNPPDVWEARYRQTLKNRRLVLDSYLQKGIPVPESLASGWGQRDIEGGASGEVLVFDKDGNMVPKE